MIRFTVDHTIFEAEPSEFVRFCNGSQSNPRICVEVFRYESNGTIFVILITNATCSDDDMLCFFFSREINLAYESRSTSTRMLLLG